MTELKQRPGDQPLPVPNDRPDIQSMVIADIEERREVGISRYGSALQAHNGRDGLRDLYEELLDGAMYARQLIEERTAAPPALDDAPATDGAALALVDEPVLGTPARAVEAAGRTWADAVRADLCEVLAEVEDPAVLLSKVHAVTRRCEAWANDLARRKGL